MDLQKELEEIYQLLLSQAQANCFVVRWESATPIWKTARLTVARGEWEVLIFEDVGGLVAIPPGRNSPIDLREASQEGRISEIRRFLDC